MFIYSSLNLNHKSLHAQKKDKEHFGIDSQISTNVLRNSSLLSLCITIFLIRPDVESKK